MATTDHRLIHLEDAHFLSRFHAKFTPAPGEECWDWEGSISKAGYAVISYRDEGIFLASRVSYAVHFGCDPGKWCVLHRCDRPVCVAPHHLFLGTRLDNVRDMFQKQRNPIRKGMEQLKLRGEQNYLAKLTDSDVERILELIQSQPQRELAAMFGVSDSAISSIRREKSWKHIPRPETAAYVCHRPRGAKNRAARLTEADVKAIWASRETIKQKVLAERFGVSQAAISLILNGTNWRHLTESIDS